MPVQNRYFSTLCVVFLGSGMATAGIVQADPDHPAAWREDIAFAANAIRETHPEPFHALAESEFDSLVAEMDANAATRTDRELMLDLARLLASIQDGHTRLTLPYSENVEFFSGHSSTPPPNWKDLIIDTLPIRVRFFAGVPFIVRAESTYADSLGGQILSIGNTPIAQVVQRLMPLVHHDNFFQLYERLPEILVTPAALAWAGVIDEVSPVLIEIQTPAGNRATLSLDRNPSPQATWVGPAGDQAVEGDPFSLALWPELGAVYVRFDEVSNAADETVSAFADRMLRATTEPGYRHLVLDLRNNRGGNNSLNRPLVRAVIALEQYHPDSLVFVLIGPRTFSAAMMLTLDLEKWTQAILIGEPTGSSAQHYGDSRKITLPNSGLTMRISTLYWQYGGPKDKRSQVEPLIAVPDSVENWLAGTDPVVAEIRDLLAAIEATPAMPPPDQQLAGNWIGRVSAGADSQAINLTLTQDSGDWSGTMSLPDLGLSDLSLKNASVNGTDASFVLSEEFGTITLTTHVAGQRMIGTLFNEGLPYRVALQSLGSE